VSASARADPSVTEPSNAREQKIMKEVTTVATSCEVPNIRLLEGSLAARELDLASELLHRINRIIPQDQVVLTVRPKDRVREAVALMRKNGFSQLPVVEKGEVLGVFSFRSFAQEAAGVSLEEWTKQKCAPGDLPVDEFLE